MFLRFFCKFLILLFISGIFPSRKKLSCEEVDSLINLKYNTKDYESALVIAKSNKNNESVTDTYYDLPSAARLTTIGMSDLEKNEDRMFFSLDNVSDIVYYYTHNKDKLRQTADLVLG